MPGTPRLLLVEDHRLFRAGIRSLLERSSTRYEIVGEATDGLGALRIAKSSNPDVILMDVTMPKMNGIETTRTITKDLPGIRVVMLSMHGDPAFVYTAIDAGAAAYVLKDDAFGDVEAAIRAVMQGQRYLSPPIAKLLNATKRPKPVMAAPASLSRRERQILQMIAEAHTSKEIAGEFGLSVRTIESYRQRMMDKLGLHSIASLTAFAISHGMCSMKPIRLE